MGWRARAGRLSLLSQRSRAVRSDEPRERRAFRNVMAKSFSAGVHGHLGIITLVGPVTLGSTGMLAANGEARPRRHCWKKQDCVSRVQSLGGEFGDCPIQQTGAFLPIFSPSGGSLPQYAGAENRESNVETVTYTEENSMCMLVLLFPKA